MKILLALIVAFWAIIGTLGIEDSGFDSNDVRNIKDAFPVVEHDGIRVTFLEFSESQTPDGGHVGTSVLFMVENRNAIAGTHSHSSPLRFYSGEKLLYRNVSEDSPRTGCTIQKFEKRHQMFFPNFPQPHDETKTILVRHWVADRLPDDLTAVEAGFGQDGKNHTFRFNVKRR